MPARIPSYRHHKPSGQAVVTLVGRDIYLGKHGSSDSRQAYERLLAEYLSSRARLTSRTPPPPDLTVNELLVRYWAHAVTYYTKGGKPTSEPDTIRQALRPVRDLYGEMQARDFGPLALKAVRQAMIERGWCRSFVNKQVNRVRKMFAWAASEELVSGAVYQTLTTVAGLARGRTEAREKAPVGPVPDELVERTLPHLSPTVAAMVRLQRLTGMRPQEVVLMQAAEVDRSDATCWVYRPGRHKGQHHGRAREIFLGPKLKTSCSPSSGRTAQATCSALAERKRSVAQKRGPRGSRR